MEGAEAKAAVTVTFSSDHSPSAETIARADALKEEGNKLLVGGKYGAAAGKYTEAIELRPSAIYLGNRAVAYLKLESYGLAIADSDDALALDPGYIKAYYRRASANMALGKYKIALRDFRQVIKLHPNDADARAKYKACDKAAKEAAFAAAIQQDEEEPLCVRCQLDDIVVDKSYDGPRVGEDGIITMQFVQEMMERFKQQKLVARRYVASILKQAFHLLRETPTLMRLQVPDIEGGHFTVCGDTHGQFYDVLNIFQLGGMPSPTNPYLFNGDFVDRGSFSVEVVLTLLAIKVACPEAIYLTRGNHESKNMNKIYGFEGEVKHKYDAGIMTMFTETFNWLPLCATINDRVFVVHGGLCKDDGVKLDDIVKVNRNREPPDSGIMSDLMWSDPCPFPGRTASKRGVGVAFGPDVTNNFLDDNGLDLLVRSHEVKEEGYIVEHDERCITVFSAPNYCDQMGNKGAFIRFEKDCKPQFTQFEAVDHPPMKPMVYANSFLTGGL